MTNQYPVRIRMVNFNFSRPVWPFQFVLKISKILRPISFDLVYTRRRVVFSSIFPPLSICVLRVRNPKKKARVMDKHGDLQSNSFNDHRYASGTINRIRLENFMCHSKLEIDFGDCVNFITGQNGSKCFFAKFVFLIDF